MVAWKVFKTPSVKPVFAPRCGSVPGRNLADVADFAIERALDLGAENPGLRHTDLRFFV